MVMVDPRVSSIFPILIFLRLASASHVVVVASSRRSACATYKMLAWGVVDSVPADFLKVGLEVAHNGGRPCFTTTVLLFLLLLELLLFGVIALPCLMVMLGMEPSLRELLVLLSPMLLVDLRFSSEASRIREDVLLLFAIRIDV